ncbi:prolyl oligopeptidase family serine peptidase, partial [Candidatus Latescibacterota bacterium]
GRLPVVLYVSGHTAEGFRSETYQHVIFNLARKGFLVFAIDPVGQGERFQYYDEGKGASLIGGPTKEHSFAGVQYLLLGRTMAMVRLWDCIRAVDYLFTRQDVDTDKIGVHGRSGGGTMSSFLGSMDERITAAAPECYITSYRRLLESIGPQDAEQNLLGQISSGLDHGDFLIARDSLPSLVVTTTRDFFSIQGARETVGSIQSSKILSESMNLSLVEDDAPHQSTQKNREAVYGFFMKAFDLRGSVADIDIPPLDPESLYVTPTGQTITSGSRTIHELIREDAAVIADNLVKRRNKSAGYSSHISSSAMKLSGMRIPEDMEEPVFFGRFIRDGYAVEKYIIDGEGNIPVPALFFVPEGKEQKQPILYIDPAGKEADSGSGGEIEKLVCRGFCVLAPDLPGYGELAAETRGGDSVIGGVSFNILFGAQLIGRSLSGIQAGHIIRACRFLNEREDVISGNITCIAKGTSGPAALHAVAVEKSITALALQRAPLSWLAVTDTRFYDYALGSTVVPLALTSYDLVDLMCTFVPKKLLVFEPVGGDAESLSSNGIETYGHSVTTFYTGNSNRFTVISADDNRSFDDVVSGWLSK